MKTPIKTSPIRRSHLLLAVTGAAAVIALTASTTTTRAQTTLNTGDISILGFNTTNPDAISVGVLTNISSGTVFTLTDNGWLAAGGFRTGEGTLTFTAPADIRAGTILSWQNGSTTNTTGFSSNSPTNFALNNGNDQITIVKGGASAVSATTAASALIYAVQSDTSSPYSWDADATSSSTSARPSLSTNPDFAPVLGASNAAYSGPTTATDKTGWQNRLGNTGTPQGSGGNWTLSTDAKGAITLPSGSINVTTALAWNPAGASGSTAWNTTTTNTNWLDGTKSTWFNTGDTVSFTNTGVGAVVIAAGGVTPGMTTFSHTSGTYTLSGGPIAGSGNFILNGAGIVNLTASNTFTGTTAITGGTLSVGVANALQSSSGITVNNGGTLLLAGANVDRVNNAAGITLAGGKITAGTGEGTGGKNMAGTPSTSGSAAGLGALTLTATGSTLDFGLAQGTLTFTTFTPGSFTLSIANYTSNANGQAFAAGGNSGTDGTDDRLIFNMSQSANLASIFFVNQGVTGAQIPLDNGYFEVVPVPEPGTIAAGLLALGTLGYSQRRRVRGFLDARRRAGLAVAA